MNSTPQYRRPGATYRLQFNQGFRFIDGRDLVPFLNDLGITDMYSSPRYMARRGSSHGYDVANPLRVNSELGTEEDFDEMAAKLRHYGMGLVLDIVPNHMAASSENPWWLDLLENGPSSAYAAYFDVDWRPATSKAAFLQENKVLLPILGDLYGNVLQNGDLVLKIDDAGIYVRYYEHRLPLDPKTYSAIVERALERDPGLDELRAVLPEMEALPRREETDPELVMARRRDKERLKERFWKAYHTMPDVKRVIDETLVEFNGEKGNPRSFDALDRLLFAQAYRVAYWKIGYEEINYRRFFDINTLVGLRVESPEVFDNRHRRTLELVRSGSVTGLRIDHVDGLWDPSCYLHKLQSATGGEQRFYIVVEKILGREEALPADWPVSGTTGYDFLNAANGILIHPGGLARLEEGYTRRTGNYLPFAELCYQANKQVMDQLFQGEVNALGHHLGRLAAQHRQARDVRLTELTRVLVEVTACLPVYRTYIHNHTVAERDRAYIEQTLALARSRTSEEDISSGAFDFLRAVLLLDPPYYLESEKKEWREFVMRWQQFTGPVMAKGLEDTATYRHNTLLSLNEVGGDPLRDRPPLTMEEFHEFNRTRLEQWPDTMNATSTHDTKRGEDMRARLNVLSEMPDDWEACLDRWMPMNEPKKRLVSGYQAPGPAMEILIYQTLVGAWPNRAEDVAGFPARVKEFLTKALRETKLYTSWIRPHAEYEAAAEHFLDALFEDEAFGEDLLEFHARIARFGAINGLAQLLIKIASPGLPDFYQGSEFWNFSLVDPDNRRSVDYQARNAALERLRREQLEDRVALIRRLAGDLLHDDTKLWVTAQALGFRRSHADLFAHGGYRPLPVEGACADHVCAFARESGNESVVVAAPRWSSLAGDWGDTRIELGRGEWHDVITGLIPSGDRVTDLWREFPVAMLAAG